MVCADPDEEPSEPPNDEAPDRPSEDDLPDADEPLPDADEPLPDEEPLEIDPFERADVLGDVVAVPEDEASRWRCA